MTTETQDNNGAAKGIAALAAREGEIILASETGDDKPAVAATPATPAATTEAAGEYTPPVVDKVDGAEQPAPEAPVTPVEPKTPEPGPTPSLEEANNEASLEAVPAVVKGPDMTNANGTAVTNIMIKRLEKHLQHIRSELGFANVDDRNAEQISFMETVGSSTTLPYDEFKLVTDTLVRAIVDNKALFKSGDAIRFIRTLRGIYPQESINRYEAYIGFLTTVAVNWATRHRLKSSVDIAIVIKDMRNAGKQNITKYFNALVAGK